MLLNTISEGLLFYFRTNIVHLSLSCSTVIYTILVGHSNIRKSYIVSVGPLGFTKLYSALIVILCQFFI